MSDLDINMEQTSKDDDDLSHSGNQSSDNQSGQTQPTRKEPFHKSKHKLIMEFPLKSFSDDFWYKRDSSFRQIDDHQHHAESLERLSPSLPSLAISRNEENPRINSIKDEYDSDSHQRHKPNQTDKYEDRKNRSKIIQILTEMGYDETVVKLTYETRKKNFLGLCEENVIDRMIDLLNTKPEPTRVNTSRTPRSARPCSKTPRSVSPDSQRNRLARQQDSNGNKITHTDKHSEQHSNKWTLYICLKGLPENPKTDTLCNFLEVCMKEDVDRSSVIFSEKSDLAVIAFINKIDISVLETKLQKRRVEGKFLEACKVRRPRRIVVSYSNDSLTKEDLYTYFNQEFVGNVVSCDERDNCLYIIRFKSHKEVKRVCEPTQRHIVKNVRLKVTPSFKCRFGEVWDYKKHEVELPEDITVTWMDTSILTFFISDKSLSRIKDINTHLRAHSAEVCCLDEEKLCIKCLLTQTTPGVRKIAESWTTDVRKTYDDIVKKTLLKIKISCSSPKIYAELKENLPKINLSKDVNVLEDEKVHCFIIVGPNTAAQDSQKKILKMKKTIESENNIVSESKTFTSGKIYILEKEGVIGQVNKIADDLDVFTDQEAGVINFKGTANDVLEAKVKIYEALNKKTVRRVYGLSPLQIKLMKNVVGLIHETFQCYNIKGAVDYSFEKIEVITSTENENILAVDLVKNFVIERVINLGFESLSVLDKQQWSFTVNKMKQDHAEKILIEIFDSIITVAATCDIFDEVFEELKSVIDHNTIISESIELNSNGEFEFLEKFRFDDLEKLQKDLSGECVQIEMHGDSLSIEISGTKSGIDKAKSSLNQEIQDIIKMKYVKKGVGISKVIEEEMEILHQTCNSYNTVVALTDSKSTQAVKDEDIIPKSGPLKLRNGAEISLIVGDIAKTQADVLVCTVSHDLNLAAGRASSGLLKAGGDSLQCECRTKFPNGIKDGEIVSVKGGNLSCKEVYFGALPRWNAESLPDKILLKFMKDCLTEAENSGYTSITFLALGTGDLGYPVTDVADLMYKCILDSERFNDGCKIKHIGFVVHDKNRDTLQAFKAKEDRLKSDLQKYLKREHRSIKCRNGTVIQLVKGEIAKEKCDVIVCGTSKELNLSAGKSCKNLLQFGGKKLQDECKKKYPEGIKEGEIAVVKGCGNLKCKEVYFGALPDWKTEQSKHRKMLWKFVESCMLKAHESGHSTIVFAALGTGALGYPPDRAAHLMYDSVIKFDNSHDTRSALKNVKFVVHYKDDQTIRGYFQKEIELLKSLYNGTHGKKNEKIKRKVMLGHIEKQKVDVIACNVSPTLNLRNGKVTHALLTCEQSLQSECQQNYPYGINIGELAVIGPGNLPCKKVYLGVLPKYEEDEENSEQVLFDFIMTCLSTASDNGYQSIAFPAVGTGDFNKYPHHIVASIVFKAVAAFERQNVGSLTEVFCVVLNQDVKSAQAFIAEEKNYSSPSFMQNSKYETESNPALNLQTTALRHEITLWLYSDNKINISNANTEIDKYIKTKIRTKSIEADVVGLLTREKIREIMDLEKKYTAVRIEVKVHQQKIILEGILEVVGLVNDEVQRILTTYQQELHVEKEAELMAESILWYYKERNKIGEKCIPYADAVSLKIERAYRRNDKKLEVSIVGKLHTVDLVKLCEYPNDNQSDVVYVIRKQMLTAGGYPLPGHWEGMEDSNMVLQKKLNCFSGEYKEVEKAFTDSVFNGQTQKQKQLFSKSTFTISEIFRIQNKTLYQQYEAKKDQINKQNPSHQNEQRPLWHGTTTNVIDSIIYNGFNRSYCSSAPHNSNQSNPVPWFGNGVYFSNDASYSCQKWLAKNSSGVQNVFMVRVLSGIYCQGIQGMRVPGKRTSNIYFDSAVDDIFNPKEFVIFNDTQAYPEYLIKFTP